MARNTVNRHPARQPWLPRKIRLRRFIRCSAPESIVAARPCYGTGSLHYVVLLSFSIAVDCRQSLPYKIREELPVIRPESSASIYGTSCADKQ